MHPSSGVVILGTNQNLPKKSQSGSTVPPKVTFRAFPKLTQSDPKSDFLNRQVTQSDFFGSKSHFAGRFRVTFWEKAEALKVAFGVAFELL